MNSKKTILTIVLVALIAVPVLSLYDSEDTDAAPIGNCLMIDTSSISAGGFDTRTAGYVDVVIENNTAAQATVLVYITYENSTSKLAEKTITIDAGSSTKVTLNFTVDSAGTKNLTIWGESDDAEFLTDSSDDELNYANFTINVDESIWSSWTTYIAIIAIVALIALAVFLKYRNAPKAEKSITFTELENQKRGKMSEKTVSAKAPTTEKKQYQSKRRQ
ncbi:MAG: hypothetical protein AB7D42_00950 [Candidatus Methanomethylophilaceae archaeon]|nr:hypothetical protein [Candidatus Methanomethylophilaceae archaeon]